MKKPASLWILCLLSLTLVTAETARAQSGGLGGLYNGAQRALQNGDYAKAIGAFQNYLDAAKDSKDPAVLNTLDAVYYGLGSAYFNNKQYTEAADKLAELLKRFPNSRLVPEVQFFLAQALFFKGDHAKALEGFKLAEKTPRFREDSLLFQAEALRKAGKASEAAEPLGRLLENGIRSGNSARGALQLAVLSAEQQNAAKAVELLTKLSGNLRFLPNVASFNQAVIVIGDALLTANKQEEALEVYRLLQNKESVLALQDRQIDQLTKLIASRRRQAQTGTPDKAGEALGDATRYEMLLAEIRKSREEFEKAPDTLPAILLRLGKAYYDAGQKWESVTAYEELLLRYPQGPDRETAVYALMVAYAEVKQFKKSQEMGEKFLVEFPQSERLEEIRYLKGVTALEGEDPEKAVALLSDLLKNNPDTKYKEEAAYLIANARFDMGFYAEARADYEAFLKAFPQSTLVSEVSYRMPLSLVFDGKYEAAIKELNEYILKNPDSQFVTDAKYRLMVSYFAAAVNDKTGELYNKIIGLTKQFETEYPDTPQLGDVLALRGDAYAGLSDLPGQANHDAEAAEAYLAGFKAARNEESQNYTLFEAIKLWQKNSEWEKVNTTLTDFIKREPDHPSAATAKYWIGRSLSRQRKDEEAKQFYATEIKAYMSQPRKDGVEMMINEMVRLLAKRKKSSPPPPAAEGQPAEAAAAAVAAVAAAPEAPAAPQTSPEEELESLIGGEEVMKNRTSTARLFLAKALLAQARNDPKMRDTYYDQLGEFEASELSAYLLGQMAEYFLTKADAARIVGDELKRNEQLDRADKFSKELLSSYPKSEFIELGYVAQGEVSHARGNHQAAYQWFKEAIDVAGATARMREAIFGQAKTLLALNKFGEAKSLFEQVASTREWRGELTPESIYNLGEIEFRQGRYREAIANYQRVYAGYAKYADVCGRAYVQSAEAFDQLGLRKEAVNTLQELLRNEKIPQRHRDAARAKLKSWGAD